MTALDIFFIDEKKRERKRETDGETKQLSENRFLILFINLACESLCGSDFFFQSYLCPILF